MAITVTPCFLAHLTSWLTASRSAPRRCAEEPLLNAKPPRYRPAVPATLPLLKRRPVTTLAAMIMPVPVSTANGPATACPSPTHRW